MPIQTSCPSCGKTLRVPDTLIGKSVKCPSCQTQFSAGEGAGATESPPPLPRDSRRDEGIREETPSRRPAREEEYEDDRPSRRPARRNDDYEDDDRDRDDEFDDDRPRRRRSRRSREYAESKVAGPAICLMVVGGLMIALALFATIFSLVMAANPGAMGGGGGGGMGGGPGGPPEPIFNVIGGIITLIWAGLIFFGGLQMKGLKSRGMAMTGAITSLIPCSACCILTLPFGIWALVVLNDEQVKEAFG
jgi:hypothetical protein